MYIVHHRTTSNALDLQYVISLLAWHHRCRTSSPPVQCLSYTVNSKYLVDSSLF